MANLAIDLGSPKFENSRYFAEFVQDFVCKLIMVNREVIHLLPRLYDSGVRYKFDGRTFRDAFAVNARGFADCASIPAWWIAEQQELGIDKRCEPNIVWKTLPTGQKLFHVRARKGSGEICDPNLALGMRSPWSFE